MHILVTGATGRIGSRLVPCLLRRGDAVRALVRQPERGELLRQHGAQIIVGDVLQPDTLARAVDGVNAVVHLAAFFRSVDHAQVHAVNVAGSLALARAALLGGVPRFVLASTNLVYGAGHKPPLRETDAPHPDGPYPASKLATEQALLALTQTAKLDLRVLRLAFVYGDGDPHLEEGLQWFRAWNPEQRFHMVHHVDVSQACMRAVDTMAGNSRIYNVADDMPVPVGDILQHFGEPSPADAIDRPHDDRWGQIVDTTRIKQEWGFQTRYPSFYAARDAGAL